MVRRIGRVQPVAEVVSAAVAETVGVVRRCAVADAFGGAGVGVAEGVSLEGKCVSLCSLSEGGKGVRKGLRTYHFLQLCGAEAHFVRQAEVVRGSTGTYEGVVRL